MCRNVLDISMRLRPSWERAESTNQPTLTYLAYADAEGAIASTWATASAK